MTYIYGGWLPGQNSGSTEAGRRRANQSLLAGQALHLGEGLKLDKNRRISLEHGSGSEFLGDLQLEERVSVLENGTASVPLVRSVYGAQTRYMVQKSTFRFEDDLGPESDGGSTTHYNAFPVNKDLDSRPSMVWIQSTVTPLEEDLTSDNGQIRCKVLEQDVSGNTLATFRPYNGSQKCISCGTPAFVNRNRWAGVHGDDDHVAWSIDESWTWTSELVFPLGHPNTSTISIQWDLYDDTNWSDSEYFLVEITDTLIFSPAYPTQMP